LVETRPKNPKSPLNKTRLAGLERGGCDRARPRAAAVARAPGRGRSLPTRDACAPGSVDGRARPSAGPRCVPCDERSAARGPLRTRCGSPCAAPWTVDHKQHPLVGIKAALDQVRQSAVATVAFSVEPSHSPSGIFEPSVVIPSATTIVRSLSSIPSIIITARRRSASWRAISSASAWRVRSMNVRYTADFDVERPLASTSSPTGSWVRL